MKNNLNRRDFLKLSSLISAGLLGSPYLKFFPSSQPDQSGKKNILVIVFDAFSARHISVYGYGRQTTPNLARLADRAIVYHNHHSGGNFTTPGTASLLTGVLPWKHRAFDLFGSVAESLADKSVFHAFKDYFRIAYSHNPAAAKLLRQFSSGLEENIPQGQFLMSRDVIVDSLFSKDEDIASLGWARYIKRQDEKSYSLFLSAIYKHYQANKFNSLRYQFPRGLPNINGDNIFMLETAIDWLSSQVVTFPRPFLGYFHFLPPHNPYNTRREFVNVFKDDGFTPPVKEYEPMSQGESLQKMLARRQQYDEYILYVDKEFGKLFTKFEEEGLLDNTWIILTSDHGEMIERGIIGHVTPVLYEPIIHIPLMIFEPGRSARLDIYDRTSAVDILPTLLNVSGGDAPAWSEGLVLPPFSTEISTSNRSVHTVQSRHTDPNDPLVHFTLSKIKGEYKLMYFAGYEELNGKDRVELYNLNEDPEELMNLFTKQPDVGNDMLNELMAKIIEMNEPYL